MREGEDVEGGNNCEDRVALDGRAQIARRLQSEVCFSPLQGSDVFPVIQDGSIAVEAFIFQITALSDEHVSFSPQQGLMR